MRHQLSITGDVDSLYTIAPELDGVTAEGDSEKIVFSALSFQKLESLKEKLVYCISNIIVEKHEDRWLKKIIKSNYKYLTAEEQKSILRLIREKQRPARTAAKKMYIEERLRDFLPQTQDIMLDGFINFRLKDYKDELEHEVDSAVDNFLAEREYEEFISLLRYFIEIQQPREAVVHIVPSEGGLYTLYGEKFHEITAQDSEQMSVLLSEEGLSYDDLLLSSLITLAPEKIVIHNREMIKNAQLLDTIIEIFPNNLSFCKGCKICKQN